MELPVDEKTGAFDELKHRLQRGDREALAELFSQQRDRLWRMINFRMDRGLQGRVDPDDVLQEGYLAAAERLEHYGNETALSPFVWLRMVILQTLTDVHRYHLGVQARDAYREVDLRGCRYPQTTAASLAALLVGSVTSPSQAVARAETLEQVEQAIADMDPLDREVLALRHFEELGNGEVAEVLGIQQKAASIRYVRALRRLKTILSQTPGFSEGG
jgi:RNA polymerase sigma-70 factor (ECF subfamily)